MPRGVFNNSHGDMEREREKDCETRECERKKEIDEM